MSGPLKNARHERFAQAIVKGETLGDAYVSAGYARNDKNAARLKKNEGVAARLTALQARVADKTVVNAAWLLDRLAEESTADIADLYADDGSLKPVKDWPLIWRQGLVAGLDVEELRQDGCAIGVIRKIKLSDRVKRLELLGKHVDVQAFREQVAQSGTVNIVVNAEDANL